MLLKSATKKNKKKKDDELPAKNTTTQRDSNYKSVFNNPNWSKRKM